MLRAFFLFFRGAYGAGFSQRGATRRLRIAHAIAAAKISHVRAFSAKAEYVAAARFSLRSIRAPKAAWYEKARYFTSPGLFKLPDSLL